MNLVELPDFEKRADLFIEGLKKLHEDDPDIDDVVSWSAEKILPDWIEGLDALQTLIGDSDSDLPLRLKDMADQLDAQSARCSIVEFRRVTDFVDPLESFVQKVLVLATFHQAQIDTSLPLGTERQTDFVKPMKVEPYGTLYRAMINFRFE